MDATPHPYPWAVRGFSLASARLTVSSESSPRGTPKANANLPHRRRTPHGFLCNSRCGACDRPHPPPPIFEGRARFLRVSSSPGQRGTKRGKCPKPVQREKGAEKSAKAYTKRHIYIFAENLEFSFYFYFSLFICISVSERDKRKRNRELRVIQIVLQIGYKSFFDLYQLFSNGKLCVQIRAKNGRYRCSIRICIKCNIWFSAHYVPRDTDTNVTDISALYFLSLFFSPFFPLLRFSKSGKNLHFLPFIQFCAKVFRMW